MIACLKKEFQYTNQLLWISRRLTSILAQAGVQLLITVGGNMNCSAFYELYQVPRLRQYTKTLPAMAGQRTAFMKKFI
jgi:hypothetical protein